MSTAPLAALTWVDWMLIVLLTASVIVGLVRGFVFEVMSLMGWIVAWFGALYGTPEVAPRLPIGASGSALNLAVTFVLLFLAVLILWSLLAKLVRMIVQATPLSLIDRALGAGFGFARGALLLMALALVVTLTPAARSPEWRGSQGAGWLMAGLQGLKPLLPRVMAERIPA